MVPLDFAPMRIIAGEYRGRKLLPPIGDVTRPITDRVKQSLFDILTPLLPGTKVYDCFAGTGSMGLESLSRGAERATFFEKDPSALKRLRQNIETLGVTEQSTIIAGDLFKWFASADVREPADLIFLDPPYRFVRTSPLPDLMRQMSRHHVPKGIIVFRHDAKDRLDVNFLDCFDRRDYGGMTIELLRPKTGA
jgi:16S rRNA (guanine966-N2)-methyltransferase